MATSRAPTKFFTARNGEFYWDNSGNLTVGSGSTLSGSFQTTGVSIQGACKNITVTPPETGHDKMDFQGEDANNFQNQMLEEKPVGMATLTATLTLGEDEVIEDYTVSGTVSGPAGYTRYQWGKNSSNIVTVCVTVADETDTNAKAVLLDNARVVKFGDAKITGADSSWEVDVTVSCLAKDFYYEVKD